ncbi:hypothetical protein [Stenotrophomonas sp. TWI587]|uniref:hypothetical protein n=1 Tax=Stenotrophomonas sp. TWI587 TaxID=3136783 RepID=UPI00320A8619
MQIFISELLEESVENAQFVLAELIEEFKWWKETWDPRRGDLGGWTGGPNCREFESRYFGKDGGNRTPLVDGIAYALRHVHLPPFDDAANEQWMYYHDNGTRKTSDCVLMYASDRYNNHLWLYVLPEPEAHDVMAMKTPADRELMEWMADEAKRFLGGDLSAGKVA